jgi:iron complex outermembrane receptor protein
LLCAAAAAAALYPCVAPAQDGGPQSLPEITVIGITPFSGGIDADKVPANVHGFLGTDLSRNGMPTLAGTLERNLGSVTINDVQGSVAQPDIAYRGFDASPVLGTPQGLAVYQNGVRINEAFGDAMNWDLVPDFAINRLSLVSANPIFGLNALGGALALEMKNGFNTPSGGEARVSGGSFGRIDGVVEAAVQSGKLASYIGGRGFFEESWRDHSPVSVHQLYADLGGENEEVSAHIAFSGASNLINAIGPTPTELLSRSNNAVYTSPQSTRNDLAFLTLTGSYRPSADVTFDADAYYRHFRQRIANGNTSAVQVCGAPVGPGTLCFNDPTTVLFDTGGQPIPNILNGATPGQIDRTATNADGVGGAAQMTAKTAVLEHPNHLVIGASLDHGVVDFRAQSELGIIASSLLVNGTGFTIDQPAGDLAPVRLATVNNYCGIYAADTLDVTSRLAVTLGGRFNLATIRLDDRAGGSLSGAHRYSRFNPAAGATYKVIEKLTAYAGYSETNRAPTAAELGCSDPTHPCIIDNFVVSDPPLKQVVAHTYEAGLRGSFVSLPGEGKLAWNLGLFRTDSDNDIFNVPSTLSGFGSFLNAGKTLRQGIETGMSYHSEHWLARLDYTYLDARFRTPLTLSSPSNPFADGSGTIVVRPGNRLPSLPSHRLKLGIDYAVTQDWAIGGDLLAQSGQYLRGDESNQNPKIPGYHVINLRSSYALTDHITIFGLAQNLFGEGYSTFGTFFDPTQIPSLGLTNPRSLTPGAPRGFFVGVRASL